MQDTRIDKFVFRTKAQVDGPETLADFFHRHTGLSKTRIKDAMAKGATWRTDSRGKRTRIRRATAKVQQNDSIELYYDPEILSIPPPHATLLYDVVHYSVWHKPAGLMTQGTNFGDHCSLLRQAEIDFHPKRKVFLVHRIDRETEGVVLIAHTASAAKRLSLLFQERKITKIYRANVLGYLGEPGKTDRILLPLDGKESITDYQVTEYDAAADTSTVEIYLKTGRKHQIRRHFAHICHPVMGDPVYGKGNKNNRGLQLKAVSLAFRCPFRQADQKFRLPDGYA